MEKLVPDGAFLELQCGRRRGARRKAITNRKKKPGAFEIVRNMRRMSSGREPVMSVVDRYFADYGDVVEIRLPGLPHFFLIRHPEHIKRVLQDNHTNYRRSIGYDFLRMFLGDGLLTSDGDNWLRHRRMMQPAFARAKVEGFAPLIHECIDAMLAEWHSQPGSTILLSREMSRLALAIVSRALFGMDVSEHAETIRTALDVALKEVNLRSLSLVHPPIWWPSRRMRAFRKARHEIDQVVGRIITTRRNSRNDTGRQDLLGMLIGVRDEDGSAMSDRQIRDEVVTFLMAGHETTANALTWTLYLLARHPHVRADLLSEIRNTSGTRNAEADDLSSMPLLSAVLHESMRMYPPVPAIERRAVENDRFGDVVVPAGSVVELMTFAVHRHADFWDAPAEFRPARWNGGEDTTRHRFAYFPFGGGPRLCIGNHFAMLEAGLALTRILQAFQLSIVPGEEPIPEASVTLRPHNEMPMRLEKAAV